MQNMIKMASQVIGGKDELLNTCCCDNKIAFSKTSLYIFFKAWWHMPTSSQDEPYIPHYNSSLKGLTSEITHILKRKELRLLNRLEPMLSRISPSPESTKPLSLCCSQLSAFGRVDPSSSPTTVTPTWQGYQGTAVYWPVGPDAKLLGFPAATAHPRTSLPAQKGLGAMSSQTFPHKPCLPGSQE